MYFTQSLPVHYRYTITQRTLAYASSSYRELYGYTEEELAGEGPGFFKLFNVSEASVLPQNTYDEIAYLKSVFSALRQTISRSKTWHGEIQNQARDDSPYWLDSVIMPFKGKRHCITSYLFIRTLITGQKNTEAQQQLYLHNLTEMVYFVSHNFRGPICSLFGLVNLMALHDYQDHATRKLLFYLVKASNDLDKVAQKLSHMIDHFELDFKRVVNTKL